MNTAEFHILSDFASLDDVELFLKKLYIDSPQLQLDVPHDAKYCQDILDTAFRNAHLPQLIGLSQGLNEDPFFEPGMDVCVMQHPRFLPAFTHHHTFLEILYVLKGSFTNYIKGQPLRMQAGDVLILAPETEHAVSVFSDEVIFLNLMIRVSALRRRSSEPCRKMISCPSFLPIPCTTPPHIPSSYSAQGRIRSFSPPQIESIGSISAAAATGIACFMH